MEEVTVTYNYPIVLISVVIAIYASNTALDLLSRVYKDSKKNKKIWVIASSLTMGIGIWSMHFTGMLAFETGHYVVYDGFLTIISMLIAILASFFAFYTIIYKKHSYFNLIFSAILIGLGISSMHYVGMHGMHVEAFTIVHNYFNVSLSVVIAIIVSYLALYIFSKVKDGAVYLYQFPIAILMGFGISGMHYTGMNGVTLQENPNNIEHLHLWNFGINQDFMLISLVATTFIIVGLMQTMLMKDKKSAEARISHMAYHDQLTGLPNRNMFNNYLKKSINQHNLNNQELAVIFIDLDRFKLINDTMGHDTGDKLLIQVSDRLLKIVRKGDVVVRQGGDEFIILLEEITSDRVKDIAERILSGFSPPFYLKGEEVFISPSIGISLYPHDGHDLETLTKHADTAMYQAKKRGKNNYQFFKQGDKAILDKKAKIEKDLKRALKNEEFQLVYQPKINLKTSKAYGLEALLRWHHPELGLIPPIEFIPIAEETGMIIPIGKWVLEEACKQSIAWQTSGIRLKIDVNVSAVQFEDSQFVNMVKGILHKNQLLPEYLGLEITESVMHNINHSSIFISELKDLGVEISIDDFGTGFSSLSILSKLPIDLVKIDKSFVKDVSMDSNVASMVKTMIEMGKNLKFDLIAEGIENEQQLKFLIKSGVQYGQGYYFSSPLTPIEVEKLLKSNFS